MDALSKILELIKFKGIVYRKLEVRAPWGIDLPKSQFLQFWKLLEGTCCLQVENNVIIELEKGDLVIIDKGQKHWISDKPDSIKIPLETYIKFRDTTTPYFLNGNVKTVMLGGHFEFDNQYQHPFLTGLPNLIHLKTPVGAQQDWTGHTTNQILLEIQQPEAGSDILISRLSEALFIHSIRAYLKQNIVIQGFLKALTHKGVRSALENLQNHPEENWTLEKLSRSSGMSRTLLFNTFKSLVGQTPLAYLQNWRMQKAKEMLLTSKVNVAIIANQVGYQSEAAFNRLFKNKFKETPASFRRSRSLNH